GEARGWGDGGVAPRRGTLLFRCDVAPKQSELVQNPALPGTALSRPVAKWPHCIFERRSDRFGSRWIALGSVENASAGPATWDSAVPAGRETSQCRCDAPANRSALVLNPALPETALSRIESSPNRAGADPVRKSPCSWCIGITLSRPVAK